MVSVQGSKFVLAFMTLAAIYIFYTQIDITLRSFWQQNGMYLQLPLFMNRLNVRSKTTEQQLMEKHFRFHWGRERNARVDWRGMMRPCFDNMDWKQVKSGWEKYQRTDASKSLIISQDIRPAGQFSRVFIQSNTKEGHIKTIGGDSWRVYLRGPASLAATIFDHNNGTYEALFLVMEPGEYRLETHLDFSLCDGFKDPPENWFRKGNHHGKSQPEGLLGFLDDYMNEPLPGSLSVRIPAPRFTINIQDILPSFLPCKEQCSFLYDGYGRWVNGSWAPFLVERNLKSRTESPGPSGMILSYGDSMALRFGKSLASNSKVLLKYKRAEYKHNWIYPVGKDIASERTKTDDLDFDGKNVVADIKQALEDPKLNTRDSTLVLNLGLHYAFSINFTSYQDLLEEVLDLVFVNQTINSSTRAPPRYQTNLIWKTFTQIKKENAEHKNTTEYRFYTVQRVLLFNAYATWRMCKAGIPVLDVLPVTSSYEPGPTDVVHYPNSIFQQAENALAGFKTFFNNQSQTNTLQVYRQCIG